MFGIMPFPATAPGCFLWLLVNDRPALEAIYEGLTPATGAPCILNSLHTSWCVGYQPPNLVPYPWRCLCFGFSQIMRTLPFLLITLHFSQIGFTDDLTFTSNPPFIHCSAYISAAHTKHLRLQSIPLQMNIFSQIPRNALIYYSTTCQTKSIDNLNLFECFLYLSFKASCTVTLFRYKIPFMAYLWQELTVNRSSLFTSRYTDSMIFFFSGHCYLTEEKSDSFSPTMQIRFHKDFLNNMSRHHHP